jgi:DNA-directed RNA polymerase specialized sigma24 family protein
MAGTDAPTHEQTGGLMTWLNRVVINKKIDRWRTEQKWSIPVAEVPETRTTASAEDVALARHALDQCDVVIKAMAPERRKAAFLRWYCGWGVKEIADWCGIAESTVRGHLMWARRQLNDEARQELPFIDDLIEDDEFPGRREEA